MINKILLKLLVLFLVISIFSCDKKEEKKDYFKDIENKISSMIYNKRYEKTIKYINSVYFSQEKNISEAEKLKLLFKQAEIKYLYLNSDKVAYKEMKKIFKNNNNLQSTDKKLYNKLLSYLTTISETIDYQNFGIFIEKLIKIKKDKNVLYKYITYLKKEKKLKKLTALLNQKDLFSKEELILLKLDLLLLKNNKNILDFINKNILQTKNQKIIDKLNIEKIFYLEQQENINYKELLGILDLIKSKNYNKFKKNKEKFYKNRISLYNKK